MMPFRDRTILRLPHTSSTNTRAMEMLVDSPPDGSVIMTYQQTHGKGQKGSTWESQAGLNLTFSIICYPTFLPLSRIFMLSKITCLAVRECVATHLPSEDVQVKWPNDLLLNGKKICGILIENQLGGTNLQASVIGIGLNVNQINFPSQFANRTSSLKRVSGKAWDIEHILISLLNSFDRAYLELSQLQYDKIDRLYLQHLWGYQEPIPIQVDSERKITPIIGIDISGRMALMWNGKLRYFEVKEAQILLE